MTSLSAKFNTTYSSPLINFCFSESGRSEWSRRKAVKIKLREKRQVLRTRPQVLRRVPTAHACQDAQKENARRTGRNCSHLLKKVFKIPMRKASDNDIDFRHTKSYDLTCSTAILLILQTRTSSHAALNISISILGIRKLMSQNSKLSKFLLFCI